MNSTNIKKFWPAFLFCLPILTLFFIFRQVLFSDAIFSHLDVLINYLPYFDALYHSPQSLQAGIIAGFPISASVSTTWFNPLNSILFHLADAFTVFRFLDMFYLLVAYVGTYFFAGQVMLWSETIIITSYYAILPLAFLLIEHARRKPWRIRYLSLITLGVLLGYAWIAGHVQFAIFVFAAVGAYMLYCAWQDMPSSASRSSYWARQITSILAVFTVATVIGWPQIWQILELLPVTARSAGVSFAAAYGYAYAPHHMLHYLLPNLQIPYLSLPQSFQNYIGILPLVIIVFGLWHFGREFSRQPTRRFFFWSFFLCLLTAVSFSPIILLFHYLPLLKTFREAIRIMFVGDFFLAILGGFLLDLLWSRRQVVETSLNRLLSFVRPLLTWVILPVAFVATLARYFAFDQMEKYLDQYFLAHRYASTVGGYPPEHYFAIIRSMLHQVIDQFTLADLGMLALIVCGFLSIYLLTHLTKLSREKFAGLAVLITCLNFGIVYAGRIHGISRSDYMDPPNTAMFIKTHDPDTDTYRIFSPMMGVSMFNESSRCSFPNLGSWNISREEFLLRKELIEPNLSLVYGLDSADGYEPYMSVSMSELLAQIGSRFTVTDAPSLDGLPISFADKVKLLAERKDVMRSLNIKYILTTYPISDGDFSKIFITNVGACKTPVYVYELSGTWPRYYVDDPSRPVKPVGPINDMAFTLELDGDSTLFVGNAYLPGWQAAVDGVPVEILPAGGAFMAINVTKGKHVVLMRYGF